jgi:hypothetical protein
MPELLPILWMLLGFVGARVAGPADDRGGSDCPAVPARPVVAWTAPQSLRADEVRLFSRQERRPSQPGDVIVLEIHVEREATVVAPAAVRLRAVGIAGGR